MFFKNNTIPLILAFVFVLSGLECGSTTAWAQYDQGMGQTMPGGNQAGSGIHNNYFQTQGAGTHRMHHFGNMTGNYRMNHGGNMTGNYAMRQFGNMTGGYMNEGYMMHQYGKNGTMGNGTYQFGQYGNQTGFRMYLHASQNSTQGGNSSENSNMTQGSMTNSSSTNQIPNWVRNNAKWWAQGQLGDSDFIQGVQYLIQQGILKIPQTQSVPSSSSQPIPTWVKTSALWWAQGQISDDDFVKGIQYLVSSGIIKVT